MGNDRLISKDKHFLGTIATIGYGMELFP